MAVVTNILLLLIIWKHKPLHTPSHILIAQLAVADWLVGASYMATGVQRLIRVAMDTPEVNTMTHCAGQMAASYFR